MTALPSFAADACASDLCQWLRREAVRHVVSTVVQGTAQSHFREHLDRLIWAFLRRAVRVPRDVPSIAEALTCAPTWPPTTIVLAAGTYNLETLRIDRPVTLLGEGTCSLVGTCTGPLIEFDCDAASTPELHRLRLQSRSHCVSISRGAAMIRSCSLASAEAACVLASGSSQLVLATSNFSGSSKTGILVSEQAHATIQGNAFDKNQCGICISHEACAVIVDNQLRRHGLPAVIYKNSARGVLQGNLLEDNKGGGVAVCDNAQPDIHSNRFKGHTMPAISFRGEAAGRVHGNDFGGNDGIGILISGKARPTVEDNRLSKNVRAADVIEFRKGGEVVKAKIISKRIDEQNGLTHELAFIDGKTGREWACLDEKKSIVQNLSGQTGISYEPKKRMAARSLDDGEGGVLLGASATKGVKRAAIAVSGTSEAVVRGNVLDSNAGYGILLCNDANPLVEANTLNGHTKPAIAVLDNATGIVRGNYLSDNSSVGIHVRGSAKPVIEGNIFERNGGTGILISDSSCPTTVQGNVFKSPKTSPSIRAQNPEAAQVVGRNVLEAQDNETCTRDCKRQCF